MTILFVTNNFPPMDGGIAVFDYHVCRELYFQRHRIVVIANSFQGSEKFDSQQGFVIKRLIGKVRPTSVEVICKIFFLVLKEKIDVVFFGHFGSTYWLGGVLAKKIFKIPYIVLVHGNEFNTFFYNFTRVDGWASRIVLKNANAIVVNSNTTKNLIKGHNYPEGHIYIVHPGIDPKEFKPGDKNLNIMRQLELNDKIILLTASRLVPIKNHATVLKALTSVIRKFPNVVYIIIGRGIEEERLRALTKDLCLEEYVRFVGYVEPEEISAYFNICDVFIMPSTKIDCEYESFGIVYLEANACGKPVIAGRSGGMQDAVIDGVTGILVDPDNIDEISQDILRLLTDQEYAKKLGENGRQRVRKELTWGIAGNKIEAILNYVRTRD